MKYIIYKITIADYTYIGSTKDWVQRQYLHKSNFFNPNQKAYNLKLYTIIRANGGWDAIEKTPIEEYECDGATQARIREEYWRREYDANMNMIRAHITEDEWIQYNRDCSKAHYAANRETIIQKGIEKIQCECGATFSRNSKYEHLRSKKHTNNLAAQQNITI